MSLLLATLLHTSALCERKNGSFDSRLVSLWAPLCAANKMHFPGFLACKESWRGQDAAPYLDISSQNNVLLEAKKGLFSWQLGKGQDPLRASFKPALPITKAGVPNKVWQRGLTSSRTGTSAVPRPTFTKAPLDNQNPIRCPATFLFGHQGHPGLLAVVPLKIIHPVLPAEKPE